MMVIIEIKQIEFVWKDEWMLDLITIFGYGANIMSTDEREPWNKCVDSDLIQTRKLCFQKC